MKGIVNVCVEMLLMAFILLVLHKVVFKGWVNEAFRRKEIFLLLSVSLPSLIQMATCV